MRLGVDLGGTKIEIAALDDDGAERLRRRIATPAGLRRDRRGGGALVDDAEARTRRMRAASASVRPAPGRASTGRFKNSNSPCASTAGRCATTCSARSAERSGWPTTPTASRSRRRIDGAAAGAEVVFGVILGTGVGGGIVVHGRVLDGPNGIAGEWGHNLLPVAQTSPSPRAPATAGGGAASRPTSPARACSPITVRHGGVETTVPRDRRRRARTATRTARRRSSATTSAWRRGLAGVINIVDPDVIVLGGGLSNIELLYAEVPRRWTRHVFSDRVDTRLVRHRHGDSSGVRGAALLWPAA